jgi:hypothetical protein
MKRSQIGIRKATFRFVGKKGRKIFRKEYWKAKTALTETKKNKACRSSKSFEVAGHPDGLQKQSEYPGYG